MFRTVTALMHGSTFAGDGSRALLDLGAAMREILGGRKGDDA